MALLLLIPMLVFTAMPNMFFGYEGSSTEDVTHMTQQALTLGGVYMSLEDFENTQVDSIITSILDEYEDDGVEIDKVKINSIFDENDLAWLIAINSAAYQQDLDAMSAQDIRTFCTSRLTHEYTLLEGQKNVLKVTVRHLDPDKLMEQLGFDDEALPPPNPSGTVSRHVRKLCERYSTGTGGYGSRPVLPPMEIAGSVELLGYNWLHITLNTLLPHCRFQPPEWLSDTIRRLLDDYEAQGCKLPFFNRAMLVIDEFTSVKGRHIFDQDNKGWKAVSNSIKGRLIPDDDQHTLAVALLSGRSELDVCHITLLDLSDAADFFSFHSGDYEVKHFYSGGWS